MIKALKQFSISCNFITNLSFCLLLLQRYAFPCVYALPSSFLWLPSLLLFFFSFFTGALFAMIRIILLFFLDAFNIIHLNSFLAKLIWHLKWLIRTSFLLFRCQFLRFPSTLLLLLHLFLRLLHLLFSMKMFIFIIMMVIMVILLILIILLLLFLIILTTITFLLPILLFVLHIRLIKQCSDIMLFQSFILSILIFFIIFIFIAFFIPLKCLIIVTESLKRTCEYLLLQLKSPLFLVLQVLDTPSEYHNQEHSCTYADLDYWISLFDSLK